MCHELTVECGSECFEIECSSMINQLTITYGNSVVILYEIGIDPNDIDTITLPMMINMKEEMPTAWH